MSAPTESVSAKAAKSAKAAIQPTLYLLTDPAYPSIMSPRSGAKVAASRTAATPLDVRISTSRPDVGHEVSLLNPDGSVVDGPVAIAGGAFVQGEIVVQVTIPQMNKFDPRDFVIFCKAEGVLGKSHQLPITARDPITALGLFNTGMDANGLTHPRDANAPDVHYRIGGADSFTPLDNPNAPPWRTNDETSRWISVAYDTMSANQTTTDYIFTFTLPAGIPHNTLVVGAQFLMDDVHAGISDVLLNGASVAPTMPTSFSAWGTFTLTGLNANPTANTVTFRVRNDDGSGTANPNPTGLRVEFLTVTY